MKLPSKKRLIYDCKTYIYPSFIVGLSIYLVWNMYGNKIISICEAKFGKTIFTSSDNDCRIDNLTYLSEKSDGNGKVYLLNVFNSKNKFHHLIICDDKNKVIDENNIFLNNVCNIDNLKLNFDVVSSDYKYQKLAELIITNHNVVNTTLYQNTFYNNFKLTINGIEYTKVFLEIKKITNH